MYEIQRFALQNIYCAPSQDSQYRFSLVRVTKRNYPVRRFATAYSISKNLPNPNSLFHVYVIGNLPSSLLNLLQKKRNWQSSEWYNVQEDMNTRNFMFQLYNKDGLNYPRANIYYTTAWNNAMVIALEITPELKRLFNTEIDDLHLRVYSNEFFDNVSFNSTNNDVGIHCESRVVVNNTSKVQLQTKIAALEAYGGKTLVYVDGYYCDKVSLNIPNQSLVEIVYDRSILSKEVYDITDLRTFHSVKDNILKYFLHRERVTDSLQYEDDLEVYITSEENHITKGLFYYQHKHHSLTNVTDKDFALNSSYVNNQAQTLSNLVGGGIPDKKITVLSRRSSETRTLTHNALKLHELYKLPPETEFEVLSNTGYTITELRAEQLENSDYFKIASAQHLKDVTNQLATSAVGYNGATYYFGQTPTKVTTSLNIEVPFLYRKASIAYEYNDIGILIGRYPSSGPMYIVNDPLTKYVEFYQGKPREGSGLLYSVNEPIPLRDSEYRVLIAQYNSLTRISTWEDVTDTPSCQYGNGTVTVINEPTSKRVRVFYFDEPHIQDFELDIIDGTLDLELTMWEDRGNGVHHYPCDLPCDSLEVFLNGRRLTNNIDYIIDFPYIGICNKTYIDYSKPKQNVHVRMTGFNLEKTKINQREITGFVSHGTLTRNNYYDISDDRVFSIYVNGKLVDKSTVRFSETDNAVRIGDPSNGRPYTMVDHVISIRDLTGLPTLPYFQSNLALDKKLGDLYDIIYPEPEVDDFNIVQNQHYVYSPTVAKVIHHLQTGVIPTSVYITNPYNDDTIRNLIEGEYSRELKVDPVKLNIPGNLLEIHPHAGNTTVEVDLYQYRFISNLVRILTNNKSDRINLSGYLTVTTTTIPVEEENTYIPSNKVPPTGIPVIE